MVMRIAVSTTRQSFVQGIERENVGRAVEFNNIHCSARLFSGWKSEFEVLYGVRISEVLKEVLRK